MSVLSSKLIMLFPLIFIFHTSKLHYVLMLSSLSNCLLSLILICHLFLCYHPFLSIDTLSTKTKAISMVSLLLHLSSVSMSMSYDFCLLSLTFYLFSLSLSNILYDSLSKLIKRSINTNKFSEICTIICFTPASRSCIDSCPSSGLILFLVLFGPFWCLDGAKNKQKRKVV